MANIIKLGNRPKHFKVIEVAVTLPDGTEGVIPVTYKYKTKAEFGAWQDAIVASAAPQSASSSMIDSRDSGTSNPPACTISSSMSADRSPAWR